MCLGSSIVVRGHTVDNINISNELLWCLTTDLYHFVKDKSENTLIYRNIPVTAPNLDRHNLRHIYTILTANNKLNEPLLTQLLNGGTPLTQTELIELCELYDNNIKKLINDKYTITHPLLKRVLVGQSTTLIKTNLTYEP